MKNSIKWLAILSMLLIVLMTGSLIACNKDNGDVNTNTDTSTDTATDTDTNVPEPPVEPDTEPEIYTVTFRQGNGVPDIVMQIDYFACKFGTANLALGTDFYGTKHLPKGAKDYEKLIKSVSNGLNKMGYTEKSINKILFDNANNFFRKMAWVWLKLKPLTKIYALEVLWILMKVKQN